MNKSIIRIINQASGRVMKNAMDLENEHIEKNLKKKKITISINYVQPSLNKLLRMHFHLYHKENQKGLKYAWLALQGKPKFKDKQVKIAYTIYFGNKHKHDYSNYGQKILDDALVTEGIIDDDSDRVIVEETLKFKYDSKKPRTEIEIEEV